VTSQGIAAGELATAFRADVRSLTGVELGVPLEIM
jgi:hypothetical protein